MVLAINWIDMQIIIAIMTGLVVGLGLHYIEKIKIQKRIDGLSLMIEHLKQQNYQMNLKQDQFSKLEDDIYKLFLKLVEEREQSTKRYQNQSKNLEDIAHQIKTPLTAMLFQLENWDDNTEEILMGLEKQISRLNQLTDILLKLSSLEANINRMKSEPVYLEEMIEYALDILDGDIQKSGVKILKEPLEGTVLGDYYWISEALINILKNAIGFSSGKNIFIRSKVNPIYTLLEIEDEGGGVEPKAMKKIFERFYKSPNSKGFGIGLAMAKTIVEANHGEITVENTDKGALFSIKFY